MRSKASLRVPTIHPSLCTKVLYPDSECRRCLSVCPTNAIHFEGRALRISADCTGCEFCIPACPNEVFSTIHGYPQGLQEGDRPFRVYCSRLLQEETETAGPLPFSIVPCLGSISAHIIINGFIGRESPLEVVTGSCPDCPMKDGTTCFEERERDITSIFRRLKIDTRPVVIRVAGEHDIQNAGELYRAFKKDRDEASALSRRDFFLNVRSRILCAQRNEGKASKQRNDCEPNAPEATEHLRSLVRLFKKYGESVSSGEVISGFSEIEIHKGCTGCGACANLCPTGALRMKIFQSDAQLLWAPARCTQCRLCAEVCTKNAVRFIPVCDPEAIMNETQRAVKHLYRHTCPECRREYVSNCPEASCVHCLKEAKTMDDASRMIYGEGMQGDSFDEYR